MAKFEMNLKGRDVSIKIDGIEMKNITRSVNIQAGINSVPEVILDTWGFGDISINIDDPLIKIIQTPTEGGDDE